MMSWITSKNLSWFWRFLAHDIGSILATKSNYNVPLTHTVVSRLTEMTWFAVMLVNMTFVDNTVCILIKTILFERIQYRKLVQEIPSILFCLQKKVMYFGLRMKIIKALCKIMQTVKKLVLVRCSWVWKIVVICSSLLKLMKIRHGACLDKCKLLLYGELLCVLACYIRLYISFCSMSVLLWYMDEVTRIRIIPGGPKNVIPLVQCHICTRGITFFGPPCICLLWNLYLNRT